MRLFCLLALFYFTVPLVSVAQNDPVQNPGLLDRNHSLKDSALVNTMNEYAKDSVYVNAEFAQEWARKAIQLSGEIEYYKGQAEAYLNLGKAKVNLNEFDSALVYADKGLQLAKRYHFDLLVVHSIDLRGAVYSHKGNYDKAASEFFNALSKAEKIHERHTVKSYANMGHVFLMLTNNNKCKKYSAKAYRLGKKYKDTSVMITALNLMGLVEKRQKRPDNALVKFEEGLEYARATRNIERQSQILYNMSNIYFNKEDYDTGFKLFNESLELSKTNGSYLSIAISFHSLAMNYAELKRYRESNEAADSALHYGLKSENFEMIMEAYAMKSEIMKRMGRNEDCIHYLEYAYIYKDSLNLANLNEAAIESEGTYEQVKQQFADSLELVKTEAQAANDRRIGEQRVKNRDRLIWIFIVVLLLGVVGVYFLIKNIRLIKHQNTLVNDQKEALSIQHTEITDSINYAQRIQDAIMAKEGEWQKISDEHFILFKPKDVVSGDFYWAYNNTEKNLSIWAVADCTGHGVPGAFMSMLGTGFLNEIVIENGTVKPDEILNKLRYKIITALTQRGETKTKDGMDISICVWDKSNKKLMFAGANNPLWIIRHKNSEKPEGVKRVVESETSALSLLEIGADKMPVGYQFETPPPFSSKEIDVLPGDVYVLLSDGFPDQFGGPDGKKYKSAPLKKKLITWQEESFDKQKELLEKEFDLWKGDNEQVDDVCVAIVRVKG